MFNATTLLRQEYEDLGERLDLDNPRHILAVVRCQAYEAAHAAEDLRTSVEAHYGTQMLWQKPEAMAQWQMAAEAEARFLQILASTVETYAPSPKESPHG